MDDVECSTAQPPTKKIRVKSGAGSSNPHAPVTPKQTITGSCPATGTSTGSQAGVTQAHTKLHALQCLSPFRCQLKDHLWRDVHVPQQSWLFKGVAKLLKLLPASLDEGWPQLCTSHDDSRQPKSLRWLLSRVHCARVAPGVVSYRELVSVRTLRGNLTWNSEFQSFCSAQCKHFSGGQPA